MSNALIIESDKTKLSLVPAVASPLAVENKLIQWHHSLVATQQRIIQREFLSSERFTYLSTIREILFDLYPSIDELPQNLLHTTCATLLNVAHYLCDWSLVIFIYEEMGFIDDNRVNTSVSLADAYCQMGRYARAKQSIETSLLAIPFDGELTAYWKRLNQHTRAPNNSDVVDNELSIVRLEAHHLNDFSWQYNTSIMELCNLPHFTQDEDWYIWFDQACDDNHAITCAIIHQEWGFIGVVHLKVIDGIGFYYYWLGEDFQGAGLGPRAVNLLLHHGMNHMNMKCCYAKVYEENIPSHKAIQKLGFSPLILTAAEPYTNEVFYHLGPDKPNDVLFTELTHLLRTIGSPLTILANQCIQTA